EYDRLSRISPERLGGHGALYQVLARIPERLPLDSLRRQYDLPDLDPEYERYFGTLPARLRPAEIGLRGPLLYGIAESERARHFAAAVELGALDRAGALMTTGHDGDRCVDRAGCPVQR